jgi:hypothetical protein
MYPHTSNSRPLRGLTAPPGRPHSLITSDILTQNYNFTSYAVWVWNLISEKAETRLRVKFKVLWDIAPCSHVEVDRRVRGTYCLHHQGDDDGGSTYLHIRLRDDMKPHNLMRILNNHTSWKIPHIVNVQSVQKMYTHFGCSQLTHFKVIVFCI